MGRAAPSIPPEALDALPATGPVYTKRNSVRPSRASVRPPRASDGLPISIPKAPAAVIPLARAQAARARMQPLVTPPPAALPALPPPVAAPPPAVLVPAPTVVPAPAPLPAPAALPAPAKPARSRAAKAPRVHAQAPAQARQPLTLMILSSDGSSTRNIRLSAFTLAVTVVLTSGLIAAAVTAGWYIGAFTAGL